MALSEQEIMRIVDIEFENSIGASGGELAEERARAYDYYLRKPFGNEEEGESQVVSSDVADVIDGTIPSLLRIFASKDNLLEFEAQGWQDEEAARQESDYVSHIFWKRNPAFEILFFWFWDALVQKTGYVKAYWDERKEVEIESYQGLSDMEFAELLEDPDLEPIERDERIDGVIDHQSGQLIESTVHDVRFRRVRNRGKVTIDNVPPDEFRISKDARSLDPSQARMVAHERVVSRGELIEMGFKKSIVKKLAAEGDTIDNPIEQARRDKTDDQGDMPNSDDKSQDLILLRETYLKIDADEDGVAELKQIFSSNGVVLEINDFDRQPFHALCPWPLPHKHVGQAWAEKVMDNQVITSTLLRQILNNLYHTNNPRKVVYEQAMGENTMDDLLTRRVGSMVRVRRPVGESIADEAVPFTAGASFPILEYWENKKNERTGVSQMAEGLSPDALKNVQQSVMAEANDLSKMKIETVARIFAETGLKTLFLHIHELAQKHQSDVEIVKLRGKWVPVAPTAWRTRRDMTVQVGLGIGTRERNLIHLNAIWEKQREIGEAFQGKMIVKPKHVYATAAEIVKNSAVKTPELFFEDPGDAEMPPQSDEQAELQKQQQEIEKRRQELDAQRQQIEQQKLQLKAQEDAAKHQREMLKLEEQREARIDKFSLENEALRNQLSEMGIKMSAAEADRVIKRISAESQAKASLAQAEQALSNAKKAEAEAAAIRAEIEATQKGIEDLVDDVRELVGDDDDGDE